MRVLLVEDNRQLAGNIVDYLQLKAYQVDYVSHAKACLTLLEQEEYDVLILDVMLPGMDGFALCQQLRQHLHLQTPVLFLTAKTELDDKLSGFHAGADDYLTKPFSMEELCARVHALSLRGRRPDMVQLQYAGLKLNLQEQTAERDGQQIKLNKTQSQILQCLIQTAPGPVSRKELEYVLWRDELPETDSLRAHVYQLRQLIDKPFPQAYIETVHGLGYRLVEPNEHA